MDTQILQAAEQCLKRLELYRRAYKKLQDQYGSLKLERDRMLWLAMKHCPEKHEDWDEIIKFINCELEKTLD